jgi:tetratricopeptide (TPR) repeat protein
MPRAAGAESFDRSASILILSVVAIALAIASITRAETASKPSFVGAAACGGCHQRELALWNGSHHQLAMEPATAASVLGNFNNVEVKFGGVTSRLYRRGANFMVRTDGADGSLQDFEIKFTFGVAPLQQYLVAMPGGRLQALGIAWDSRPRDQGGQRWFQLYPETDAGDPLHWTGIDHNWNSMCADCHSTNLRENYHLSTHSYATSYAEINVACEACHGPGSNHVAWAKTVKKGQSSAYANNDGLLVSFDERRGVSWRIDPKTGNPVRSKPRESEHEIQVCARCHSRRSQIHEDYVHGQPVGDDYRVALLEEGLYFPDGQIKDEVYEYGSFIQSRMFHAGVTCSDCHEPHSLKLRVAGSGVCLQCHLAAKYDSPKHHFHKVGSAGARCVECHLPARTYMMIDARRDHSIRIPRPDLSVKLGTPNACTNCHRDKPATWAMEAVQKWYRHQPAGYQHFAEALQAGRVGAPGAEQSLDRLVAEREQPAIARATGLTLLVAYPGAATLQALRSAAGDGSPLVRRAAAQALSDIPPDVSAAMGARLLADKVRAVRIEAAEALAGVPSNTFPSEGAVALRRAIDEYVAAQNLNADRPESHLNRGLLYAKQEKMNLAEGQLKTALEVDPSFAPAAVNLADLYRETNRDAEGEKILRAALRRAPKDAALREALGLLMVRQHHNAKGLDLLGAAARTDPSDSRYAYVYAIALNDSGQTPEAIETLKQSLKEHPYDRDSLGALISFLGHSAHPADALAYAQRLSELEPDDPALREMIRSFEANPRR